MPRSPTGSASRQSSPPPPTAACPPARTKAGIGTRSWTYPQIASTALLSASKAAQEYFEQNSTPERDLHVVPSARSKISRTVQASVWLMSRRRRSTAARFRTPSWRKRSKIKSEFASRQCRKELRWAGRLFPMAGMSANRSVGHRVALIGGAGHISRRSPRKASTSACGIAPLSSKFWKTPARSGATSAPRRR